jgi:hypothetical protein
LPIVLGVTGHRDLRPEDLERLDAVVEGVMLRLLARYASTPLVLLSALAEGADRLVARVAVRLKIGVIVPMPMPRRLYEDDFATAESRTEFDRLIGAAQACFAVDFLPGLNEDDVRRPGAARDQQYAQAGAFIARHCQILIALWDGRFSDLVGGTSQVTRFQVHGVPEPYAPAPSELDSIESGPLCHVLTPRLSSPQPVGPPFEVRWMVRQRPILADSDGGPEVKNASSWAAVDRMLRCVDTFNRDTVRLKAKLKDDRRESAEWLLPDVNRAGLPESIQSLVTHYAVADSLAIHMRNNARRTLATLVLVAFVALVLFEIFAHVAVHEFVLLAANLVVVGLAYALYAWAGTIPEPFAWLRAVLGTDRAWRWWAKRQDFKTRYLDYRALAEGMRVQVFWMLVGLPDSVADRYLRKQRSELDWIRNAVLTWALLASSQVAPALPAAAGDPFELVLVHWIRDQATYFRTAAQRNHRVLHRLHAAVHALLMLGIATTMVLLVMGLATELLHEFEPMREVLVLVILLLSTVAAFTEGYLDKMAFAEEAKRYQQMAELLERASRRLVAAQGDLERSARIVQEVGQEALAENGDWVLLHRSRPLNVPME